MLYGLLIETATVEQQETATLSPYGAADDEESGWLGMEAWVCCDSTQTQFNA